VALFRRKKPAVENYSPDLSKPLPSVVAGTFALQQKRRLFTAAEADAVVRPHTLQWGPDSRVFLLLSDDVRRDGRSTNWEFHVLFPTLRAEGIWALRLSDDRRVSELSYRIAPVPEPGSTEFLMAQISPQIINDQETAWQQRLSLLDPLPEVFVDSPSAVSAISVVKSNMFASGPIRLKARRLPTGDHVWETKGVDLVHVPFVVTPGSTTGPVATVISRHRFDT
jgi:hypothetical protein